MKATIDDDDGMSKPPGRLSDQIRRAVGARDMTRYAVCKALSIDQSVMHRFMERGAGMELANIDRLADLLGLTIKRVRVAKAIFTKTVKWGLIASNPFAGLRAGSQTNPDRAFYVDREAIAAILAVCPDDQWRGIVALVRYAGLRCPSEVVGLSRSD